MGSPLKNADLPALLDHDARNNLASVEKFSKLLLDALNRKDLYGIARFSESLVASATDVKATCHAWRVAKVHALDRKKGT